VGRFVKGDVGVIKKDKLTQAIQKVVEIIRE
jgi:hypothetical protein